MILPNEFIFFFFFWFVGMFSFAYNIFNLFKRKNIKKKKIILAAKKKEKKKDFFHFFSNIQQFITYLILTNTDF